ncbi:MAG: hypothetical protein FD123_1387 [Bacteroidetes bacterium]|nr:MAG: hypothetical protein FD123_1387 [Bacteroidota bacterium]
MRFYFSVILFFIATGIFGQEACDCQIAGKASVANTAQYDLIFIGRVDSVGECSGKQTVWFNVTSVYKGEVLVRMPVTYDCNTDCKFNFAKGQEWLMYTDYEKYGEATAEVCSRSRRRISNPVLDMYLVSSGQTFDEELAFVDKTYHRHKPMQEKGDLQPIPDRKNDIPKGWVNLWLILGSGVGILVIYFLVRKFWK